MGLKRYRRWNQKRKDQLLGASVPTLIHKHEYAGRIRGSIGLGRLHLWLRLSDQDLIHAYAYRHSMSLLVHRLFFLAQGRRKQESIVFVKIFTSYNIIHPSQKRNRYKYLFFKFSL